MNKNIHLKIENAVFKEYAETVWCSLKKSNSKGSSYDPNRQTGFTKTLSSPLPIKAIVYSGGSEYRTLSEIGYNDFGTIIVIVKNSDVNLIKIAEKIKYNDEEYSLYKKGLGNKAQISKRGFGFYKCILYKIGK